ncbi:MAG: S41 family peptidase, partial [Oscillospiraceae bacterium]|nr:S41 family peptidase [Oscillospiraceae bacterium]
MAIVCALTFIVTSFISLQRFNTKVQAVKEKAEKYSRLEVLDTYVREHYYQSDLDEDGLMNGILKGYVAGLNDPYSVYMTEEEYASMKMRDSGREVGIGVTIVQNAEGYAEIVEVQEGSPAEQGGLKVGDVIVAVEGKDLKEAGYEESINNVRGEPDTKVRLTIRRKEKDSEFTITRRDFELKTIKSELLEGHIGYIRIRAFRENTDEQFQAAMDDLIANGADALLFDVRNNGGGLLDTLQTMLDPLLPEGVIATATYQNGESETVISSDDVETDLPIVILVNGKSASASELFSASLRDFKNAKLIGTQTYGKGVMQNMVPMPDGGGLNLTVATYQTTKSECYHGVGLTPDEVVEPSDDTDVDAIDPGTDPQLTAAIAALSPAASD